MIFDTQYVTQGTTFVLYNIEKLLIKSKVYSMDQNLEKGPFYQGLNDLGTFSWGPFFGDIKTHSRFSLPSANTSHLHF